jgi:hypothetical protein
MDEDLPKDLEIEYLQNKQIIYYLDSIQVREVLLNLLRMNSSAIKIMKPSPLPLQRKSSMAARISKDPLDGAFELTNKLIQIT